MTAIRAFDYRENKAERFVRLCLRIQYKVQQANDLRTSSSVLSAYTTIHVLQLFKYAAVKGAKFPKHARKNPTSVVAFISFFYKLLDD